MSKKNNVTNVEASDNKKSGSSVIYYDVPLPTSIPRDTYEDFDGPVVVLDLDETLIKFLKSKHDRAKKPDFMFEHEYNDQMCKYRFIQRNGINEFIDDLCELVDEEKIVLAVYTASQRFYAEKVIEHIFKDKLDKISILLCYKNLGVRKYGGKVKGVLCKDLDKLASLLCVDITRILMIDDSPQWFAQRHLRQKHLWVVPSIDIYDEWLGGQKEDMILPILSKSIRYWLRNKIQWTDVIRLDANVERRINKGKLDMVAHETDLEVNPFFLDREILLEILRQICDNVRAKKITQHKYAWIKDDEKREEIIDKTQRNLLFSSISLLDRFILFKLDALSIDSSSLEECDLFAVACVYLINPYVYQTTLSLNDMCKMIYEILHLDKSTKNLPDLKSEFVQICEQLRELTHFDIYQTETLYSCFSVLVKDIPKLSLDDKYMLETICCTILEDSMDNLLFLYASQDPSKFCKAILQSICEILPFPFIRDIEVPKNASDESDTYYKEFKNLMMKQVEEFAKETINAIQKSVSPRSPRRSSISFGVDARPVYDVIF